MLKPVPPFNLRLRGSRPRIETNASNLSIVLDNANGSNRSIFGLYRGGVGYYAGSNGAGANNSGAASYLNNLLPGLPWPHSAGGVATIVIGNIDGGTVVAATDLTVADLAAAGMPEPSLSLRTAWDKEGVRIDASGGVMIPSSLTAHSYCNLVQDLSTATAAQLSNVPPSAAALAASYATLSNSTAQILESLTTSEFVIQSNAVVMGQLSACNDLYVAGSVFAGSNVQAPHVCASQVHAGELLAHELFLTAGSAPCIFSGTQAPLLLQPQQQAQAQPKPQPAVLRHAIIDYSPGTEASTSPLLFYANAGNVAAVQTAFGNAYPVDATGDMSNLLVMDGKGLIFNNASMDAVVSIGKKPSSDSLCSYAQRKYRLSTLSPPEVLQLSPSFSNAPSAPGKGHAALTAGTFVDCFIPAGGALAVSFDIHDNNLDPSAAFSLAESTLMISMKQFLLY